MSEGVVLRLPFDMYGRYRAVADAVDAVRGALGRPLRVLDVGGLAPMRRGGPLLPARLLLPQDEVVVLDRADVVLPGYVRGDGRELAYDDGAFDVVISCDALEHVPPDDRPGFWGELLRVARIGVVLAAPFETPEVAAAEELLLAYIRAELGYEQAQLREHAELGRPDLAVTLGWLGARNHRARAFPSGYVHAWLAMMVAKHYLYSRSDDEELHEQLDAYYTRFLAAHDRREPAYRHVLVVECDGRGGWWQAACAVLAASVEAPDAPAAPPWPDLARWLMPLLGLDETGARPLTLAHTTAAQLAEIGRLQAALAQRDAQIADLEERAVWLAGQAEAARSALEAVERGRVMRLLRRLTWRR